MKKLFLTPGPSELYFTVPDHIQTAMREGVASISHRSKDFEKIFKLAVDGVRTLLEVPENYHIVFTNSATEIWERLIQNCIADSSYHFVNGSFSQKFYDFSKMMGKNAHVMEVALGQGFDINNIEIPNEVEVIGITQNETSSGVAFPVEDIYQLRNQYPDKIIAIDAVSSVPYLNIDFQKIDSLYFSVQKGMGLPAGLGVWVFNEKLVEKVNELKAQKIPIGTYHTIPGLLKMAAKNQTPATPNVLGIYLLGKVCEDMNRRGIQVIRQETNYKAALLYNLFESNNLFEPFVKEKKHRSKTVAVGNLIGQSASEFLQKLGKYKMEVGKGYGGKKESQIRIANFPTHSKESIEMLVDLIEGGKLI
ncbi:MAG: aminotransferase class V-fold PLP-dependent enzyme [Flammeovirgaceae bacterium]|nr:aminotransferase class V-fold PLP-dependent enzyme [Flammeovirgaceae bacterium]